MNLARYAAYLSLVCFTLPIKALPPGFEIDLIFDNNALRNPNPEYPGGFVGHPNVIETLPDGRVFIGMMDNRAYLWDTIEGWTPEGRGILPEPFFDYRGRVGGEMGIGGCVASPDYETTGHFFVSYTLEIPPFDDDDVPEDRRIRIERFTADPDDMTKVIPDSGKVVFDIADDNLRARIHFAMGMAFGPNGELFFTLGDDGITANSQSLTSFRGKVLRMAPDGSPLPDNPYYIDDTLRPENYIWALGLRNPFRIRYDAVRDILFCADTGQSRWEELNIIEPGANYGWPIIDGPLHENPNRTPPPNYRDPYFYYGRGLEGIVGHAIVSPIIYRGDMFPPEYFGDIFVTDWGYALIQEGSAGKIFHLSLDEEGNLLDAERFYVYPNERFGGGDLTVLPDGSLLLATAAYVRGEIHRIWWSDPTLPPDVSFNASVTDGPAPLSVSFQAQVDGATDGNFAWDFGDGRTSTQENPSITYNTPGRYTVSLTVNNPHGVGATHTVEIGVYQSVETFSIHGTIREAVSFENRGVRGTIRFLENDGVTPLVMDGMEDGVIIHANADGSYEADIEGLRLYESSFNLQAEAGMFIPHRIRASSGQPEPPIDFYLSNTALTGVVRHSQSGAPMPGVDVLAFLDAGENQRIPYRLAYGFEGPNAPGYPSGVLTDWAGEFYLPIRPWDEGGDFVLRVNTLGSLPNLAAPETLIPSPGHGIHFSEIRLYLDHPIGDCEMPRASGNEVNFSTINQILASNCIGCHGDTSPYSGLVLMEGFVYSSLVNRMSAELPSRYLVQQGIDPEVAVETSFLLEKMSCTVPSSGAPMPPTSLLSETDRQRVADWIAGGAHHDTVSVSLFTDSQSVTAPNFVQFHGGAEGPGAPISFHWDFGDGSTSNLPSPRKVFLLEDGTQTTRTVTLTARNSLGEVLGTKSVDIQVNAPQPAPENLPPVAILPESIMIEAGTPLVLSATDSYDPDGFIVAYAWDLEDSGDHQIVRTRPTLPHVWDQPGIYTVNLLVVDNQNKTGTTSVDVHVLPRPGAGIWMMY